MLKNNYQSSLRSIKSIVGIVSALSGIASGILYEYHLNVVVYQPNDTTNTLGLYMLCLSLLLWTIFLAIHFTNK